MKLPVCVSLRMKFKHRVKQVEVLLETTFDMEDMYTDILTCEFIPEIWGLVDYKRLKEMREVNEISMVTSERKVFRGVTENKDKPPASKVLKDD